MRIQLKGEDVELHQGHVLFQMTVTHLSRKGRERSKLGAQATDTDWRVTSMGKILGTWATNESTKRALLERRVRIELGGHVQLRGTVEEKCTREREKLWERELWDHNSNKPLYVNSTYCMQSESHFMCSKLFHLHDSTTS